MTVTAVITSHANQIGLQRILQVLGDQTRPPDETLVLVSGYEDIKDSWIPCENKNDAGHDKRYQGLKLSNSEYTGFFNDDDWYNPQYLEKMLTYSEDSDLVYCDFVSHLFGNRTVSSSPNIGQITSGNFIVKTSKAREVGYNHRNYTADGMFIKDLVNAGATTKKVNEVLYVHL